MLPKKMLTSEPIARTRTLNSFNNIDDKLSLMYYIISRHILLLLLVCKKYVTTF